MPAPKSAITKADALAIGAALKFLAESGPEHWGTRRDRRFTAAAEEPEVDPLAMFDEIAEAKWKKAKCQLPSPALERSGRATAALTPGYSSTFTA